MKNFKKIISVILAVLTVFSVSTTAIYSLAAELQSDSSATVVDYYDFSEYNLASSFLIDAPYGNSEDALDLGGNQLMSTAYYSRWSGPVNEVSDPYPQTYGKFDKTYTEYPHILPIKSMYYIGNSVSEVKGALMNYGALFCSFMFLYEETDDNFTNIYTKPDTSIITTDYSHHAVTVVGWDDNYPKENFVVTPPGDGAIICKNSWDTDRGDDGFIYISYYDYIFQPSLLNVLGTSDSSNFVSFNAYNHTPDYNKIYQYDEYGMLTTVSERYSKIDYVVNVFPEEGNALSTDEILRAVSFYAKTGGTKYEIYLIPDFKDKNDANIKKSGAKKIASGAVDFAGYHVIDLDKDYILNKGSRFGIAVKLYETSLGNANYAIETPTSYFSPKARSNRGESYYKSSDLIIDLYDDFENSNWCIKAFTAEANSEPVNGAAPNGFISNPLFGTDNKNRRYESDKIYGIDELVNLGCEFSKEFLDYIANPAKYSDGIIPSPVNFSNTQSVFSGKYPEKYDLRDHGYSTSVKDQGNLGTCWAFASTASLESSCLKNFGNNGTLKDVNIVEKDVESVVSVTQKGSKKTFKFTAEDSGLYSFNLGGGAFITEITSQFGVIHDTIRTSEFKLTLKENESVYFNVKFADADATGDISVTVSIETTIEKEEEIIRLATGENYSGTIPAGSSQKIEIYNNACDDTQNLYINISCNSALYLDDLYIETNISIPYYLHYNESYVFSLIPVDDSDVTFTIEIIDYIDYYLSNYEDIGSATEYTPKDENTVSFKFTPENSGIYSVIYENDNWVMICDESGTPIEVVKDKSGYYYLNENVNYYIIFTYYVSEYFRIVEWKETHSETFELTEGKTTLDIMSNINDVANYIFTAPEDGVYNLKYYSELYYLSDVELTDNNGNTIDCESFNFGSETVNQLQLSKGETINISFKIKEDLIEISPTAFTILIEKSDSGIKDLEAETKYDFSQNSINNYYKFTPEKDGYYVFRITDNNKNATQTDFHLNYSVESYCDYLGHIRFFDGSYGLATKLTAGSTYYFNFENDGIFDISFEIETYPEPCYYSPSVLDFNNEPVEGVLLTDYDSVEIPLTVSDEYGLAFMPNAIIIETPINAINSISLKDSYDVELQIDINVSDDKTVYTVLNPYPFAISDDSLIIKINESCEFKVSYIDYTPYDTSFKFDYSDNLIKNIKESAIEIIYEMLENMLPNIYNHDTRYYREEFTMPVHIGQGLSYKQEDLVWKSTNEAVVTVDENGNFKCVGLGSSIVSAESPDGNYRCTRTIYVKYSWWQWLLNILTFGQIWK